MPECTRICQLFIALCYSCHYCHHLDNHEKNNCHKQIVILISYNVYIYIYIDIIYMYIV